MKHKKQKTVERKPLCIRYNEEAGGWLVDNSSKKLRPFASKMDAENFCIQKLGSCPITILPQTTEHQDLPRNSVWTGAPWDKTFKDV
jgi:hypothetical protein